MILKDKNILITGGGKGIGYSCIENFIKEGAYVYAIIRSKEDFKKFKRFKKDYLKLYLGDVTNTKLIHKILSDSIKSKKKINCLVNNAGVRFRKKFLEIKERDLLNVFDINFFSIFKLSQIFCKFLIKNKLKGSILNISSIVGQIGFEELSVYASSKGALTSFTKSLATEMIKKKIRVNSISPGFTKSSFFKKFKRKKKLYKWTLSRIPMGRWGETSEISSVISFIISDKASYINGENINIDGGWLGA